MVRDDKIDRIKGILIFLVVFGHLMVAALFVENQYMLDIHYYIYAFHMPAFILISGYLSKRRNGIKKLVITCLVPYVVCNSAFVCFAIVMGWDYNINILLPTYSYWYILCIFFMRLAIHTVDKHKWVLILIILANFFALYIPETIWRVLSIGRVFLLFPVFYIGFKVNAKHLQWINQNKRSVTVVGLMAIITETILLKSGRISVLWATHSYPKNIETLLFEWLYMFIALTICAVLYIWMPTSKVIERFGRNSMIVYLVHPFLVVVLGQTCRGLQITNGVKQFIITLLGTFLITYMLSLECIAHGYHKILKKIENITRKEKVDK